MGTWKDEWVYIQNTQAGGQYNFQSQNQNAESKDKL